MVHDNIARRVQAHAQYHPAQGVGLVESQTPMSPHAHLWRVSTKNYEPIPSAQMVYGEYEFYAEVTKPPQ